MPHTHQRIVAKKRGFLTIQAAGLPVQPDRRRGLDAAGVANPQNGRDLSAPARTTVRQGFAGIWLSLCAAVLAAAALSIPPAGAQVTLAPYLATPGDVVDRMLRLAGVKPSDTVYDLGSGDGRIVIAAAKNFGARGVGIEIDPSLVAQATANARSAGVADRVTFRLEDAMTSDLSSATVVTLYLLAASNVKLRPRLQAQLRPGARIVAHNFGMGDWEPDRVDTFRDAAGATRTLYVWTIR